ncbi:hypothetical protein ACIQB5_32050 [Streptomyces sp. NPDC088560]|uniref:hypothetical protein n=1 Tax=Streptomyces sp. NPDC088560 TaxID=3365868 RepID=UPI00381F4D73
MRRTARALSVALAAGAALFLPGPTATAAPAGPLHSVVAANCDTTTGTSPGNATGPPPPGNATGPMTGPMTGGGTGGGSGGGTGSMSGAATGPTTGGATGSLSGGVTGPLPGSATDPLSGGATGPSFGAGAAAGPLPDPASDPLPGAVEAPAQLFPETKPCADSGGTQCRPGDASCRESTGCRDGESCADRTPCRDTAPCQSGGRDCLTSGSGSASGRGGVTGSGACSDTDTHTHTCTEPSDPRHDSPHAAPSHGTPSRDGDDCAPAGVQHGVEAGQGGSFTGSVPALVAGGVLIAAACAGAGHRLHGHRRAVGRPTGG